MTTKFLKTVLFAGCLLLATDLYAQKTTLAPVVIYLKNTALLPKKFNLISYAPSEAGNTAVSQYFMPGKEQAFTFEEGTKLYLASNEQVATVMSGQRIDKEKPFLVVKKSDAGKTFSLK
ncbi:hypothetical protein [Adhaeribacter pallidiroseus]|uniref:Uncharacterized protein n=1 Tax=Adhaeribacter pallidiroseus TaxID=2072847 RepID=A0A369QL12_9BACT|nr:hypothetical protein [Adhaeribacter pallidiroseus]RDC65613.1 hypothetical protein AHMF7616_04243 [Adhaeribacter pallidiroseus]